jgi:hypothetical protein
LLFNRRRGVYVRDDLVTLCEDFERLLSLLQELEADNTLPAAELAERLLGLAERFQALQDRFYSMMN